MLVREVRWSDFDDISRFYFHLYDERARGDPIGITLFDERPSVADEVQWFGQMYREVLLGTRCFAVAEVDGRVVGDCSISRASPFVTSETSHVGVLGIIVAEEHRGRGVGSALLRHALEWARSRFEVVRLSVFSVNEGAHRLYLRFGFVDCGRIPRAIRRGTTYYDELHMALVFPPGATGAGKH